MLRHLDQHGQRMAKWITHLVSVEGDGGFIRSNDQCRKAQGGRTATSGLPIRVWIGREKLGLGLGTTHTWGKEDLNMGAISLAGGTSTVTSAAHADSAGGKMAVDGTTGACKPQAMTRHTKLGT